MGEVGLCQERVHRSEGMAATLRRLTGGATLRSQRRRNFLLSRTMASISASFSNPKLSPEALAEFYHDQFDEGEGVKTFTVLDPARGTELASLKCFGERETQVAVERAHAAFKTEWNQSRITGQGRYDALVKWEKLIRNNAKDLSTLVTLENGKPLSEATMEVTGGADSVAWFAEEARRIEGDVLQGGRSRQRVLVLKQGVGVVGAITPWNFPFSMITRKISPALAAGCTVVVKPSEETPLSALALTYLAHEAGFPKGSVQVVCGDAKAIGKELTGSKKVRKIGFTGSTAVGRLLMAQSASSVKRISLELGGNAPFIVFDDADLRKAAGALVGSGLRNAGQTCICADKVLVHDAVYDEFASILAEKMERASLGHGLDPKTSHGPLINERAIEKVESHVREAVGKGAKLVTGGERVTPGDMNGYFYAPTLLTDVTLDMACFTEENFGPVISLYRFHTDEEAVEVANDSEYGLAAYFYTSSMRRSWTVSEALEYGMVGCNDVAVVSVTTPFGGWKQSGIGVEHSKYGIDEFLQKKAVFITI